MANLLDIIAAFLIGGILFLMIIGLNIRSSEAKFASDSELLLQRDAQTLAEILSHDLRKIGYGYSGTSIITADSTRLTFIADVDTNSVLDTITLYLGDPEEVTGTPNPRDRYLYRIINGVTSAGPVLGLVRLRFNYRDALSAITTNIPDIKYIEVQIWVETGYPVNDTYPFTYWEMKIKPRNL